MALTLITNPVGTDAVKIFSGFNPVEFEFKREDLQITSVASGSGGIIATVPTDLTGYLSTGDSIYIYSEGAAYTYDGTGIILGITASDITIDIPFIQTAVGGYINYFKNYYVELQCVDRVFSDANILPFSLKSDGDSSGIIKIDVSIANDLNRQRGAITSGFINESSIEFNVKYRQVYTGSSESFTLVNTKLIVLSYATETPESDTILNKFDLPCLYLGYKSALVTSNKEDSASSILKLVYNELDINKNIITSGTLGEIDSDVNGFILWEFPSDISLNETTNYINFDFDVEVFLDFKETDFAYPDFYTQ